ncbi:MAG TPA: hypothetical protein VGB25_03925 [Candidatus Binatia bacterium]
MNVKYLILGALFFWGVFLAGPMAVVQDARAQGPGWRAGQGPWDNEAEQAFGPGRGMGRQLMTQEEWAEHQQKMRSLGPEEREKYREEWHAKMVERARERGITMPETPGPRRGRGRGGMGPGGWR